jgi:FkbM family methyltransferase
VPVVKQMRGSVLPTVAQLFECLPRYLRRHKLMKAWMGLTGEDPVQLVRIRDDAFGYADMSDGFLRLVVIDGQYDEEFFRVADQLLSQGGVFFDVGANYGLLSFGLAKKFYKTVQFHLFEPNPSLVRSIERTRELYSSMRSLVNEVAVSDENGVVLFDVDPGQTGRSHITEVGGSPVPSIKLDDYISAAQLERIDFVKLDIEGYELSALRGAERALRNRTVKAVYFEYFEKYLVRVAPPNVLITYLESLGFEVCFCRRCDFETRGTPALTLKKGLPGHGLPLLAVRGYQPPAMTDLLAVPKEHLAAI